MDMKIQYPISKDTLQKGFNLRRQIEKNVRNKFIDEYIDKEVDEICLNIINNTVNEELYLESVKNTIEVNIVKTEENQDKKYIYYSDKLERERKKAEELIKKKQQYLYEFRLIENQFKFSKTKYCYASFNEEELNFMKDQIYKKLKERFLDISIQMDPIKNYILIDWN